VLVVAPCLALATSSISYIYIMSRSSSRARARRARARQATRRRRRRRVMAGGTEAEAETQEGAVPFVYLQVYDIMERAHPGCLGRGRGMPWRPASSRRRRPCPTGASPPPPPLGTGSSCGKATAATQWVSVAGKGRLLLSVVAPYLGPPAAPKPRRGHVHIF
jgi:hypothetical protein